MIPNETEALNRYLKEAGIPQDTIKNSDEKKRQWLKSQIERSRLQGIVLDGAEVLPTIGPQPTRRRTMHLRGCKLQLLPYNPSFAEYKQQVRQVLGLPINGIQPPGDYDEKDLPPPWREFGLDVFLLKKLWVYIHRSKAKGVAYRGPELVPCLPRWLLKYAKLPSPLAMTSDQWPEWLKAAQLRPPSDRRYYDEDAPLDRFSAALTWVFDLPPRAFYGIRDHVLTEGWDFLESGNPLEVCVKPVEFEGALTISVTIGGIDGYTAKAEWDEIWAKHVEPQVRILWGQSRQQEYFNEHGQWPALGKCADFNEQTRPVRRLGATFHKQLQMYELYRQHRSYKKAADEYSKLHPEDSEAKVDGTTIRRAVDWVENSMKPAL